MHITQVLLNPPEQVEKWVQEAIAIADRTGLTGVEKAAVITGALRLLGHGVPIQPQPSPLGVGMLANGLKLPR